jgi:rhodanese-related sulfurtransferase
MTAKLTDLEVSPAQGYAGDVSAVTAWRMLEADRSARLIDVRTAAEWAYVGGPDLSSIGHKALQIEWQQFPAMIVDPQFTARVQQVTADCGGPLLFLCRSGARSAAAARALAAQGRERCFNVADGFEGPLDSQRHRGTARGWKASGLPWLQS